MSAGARAPDFLGIGAQKTASSWLYKNLRDHPDIWTPKVKELHYFDEKAGPGRRNYWKDLRSTAPVHRRWRRTVRVRIRKHRNQGVTLANVRWDLRFLLGRYDDDWYASLFRPGAGKLTGEVTPDYSAIGPERVAHVHRLMPGAKILFFMRNPIERAWSQAMMLGRKSGAAHERLLRSLESEHSRRRTDYLGTLANWRSAYPDEQIFVGFHEDVHFHPDELLARVYAFLGVPNFGSPHAARRHGRGSTRTIPRPIAIRIAELYGELLDELDRSFGGWASWWSWCRDRIVADDGLEEVPYPFYETPLVDEWLGERDPVLQSGALAGLWRSPERALL